MKKQSIAATVLAGVLMLGVSACSRSNSAQLPNSSSTQTNNTSVPNQTQQAARAQRREAVIRQVEAVLTPEQAQQFQTKLQSGERMRQALRELNLTANQKTKIQDILRASYSRQQNAQGG